MKSKWACYIGTNYFQGQVSEVQKTKVCLLLLEGRAQWPPKEPNHHILSLGRCIFSLKIVLLIKYTGCGCRTITERKICKRCVKKNIVCVYEQTYFSSQSQKPTLFALCNVVTWTGVSKLTPPSLSVWTPTGVETGLGLRLELDTPEEELGAMSGSILMALGMLGTVPGSKLLGLMTRLAWMWKEKNAPVK